MEDQNKKQEVASSEVSSTAFPKAITISRRTAIIIGCVIAFGVLAFLSRGIFVAATVNGSPISRLSVIEELENQGGKAALDALITEKLITNEAAKKGVAVTDAEIGEELQKIEAQVTAQGGTLAEALAQQGMTEASLKESIRTQTLVQKLLSDTVSVTDEEVGAYIADNEITLPAGQEQQIREQLKDQMADQKLQQEAQVLVTNLRNDAKIKYYVNY